MSWEAGLGWDPGLGFPLRTGLGLVGQGPRLGALGWAALGWAGLGGGAGAGVTGTLGWVGLEIDGLGGSAPAMTSNFKLFIS